MILAKLNGKELPDKPAIKWFKGKWLELDSKSGARFSFKESHDSASNVRTLWGLEGLWARAGDRVELLGRGCAGQEGRMFGPGQGAPGHGVCVPRELSGSGTQAPRGQDCPGMGRDSWPFLGALRAVRWALGEVVWHWGSDMCTHTPGLAPRYTPWSCTSGRWYWVTAGITASRSKPRTSATAVPSKLMWRVRWRGWGPGVLGLVGGGWICQPGVGRVY